jgi:Domain of unknown function (DUF4276)
VRVRFLVEGPSEKDFIDRWCRRLNSDFSHSVFTHQGRGRLPRDLYAPPDRKVRTLLHQLPSKLRGFAAEAKDRRDPIVVLLDADDDDPRALHDAVAAAAQEISPFLDVRIVVAVEELEAFYLGDQRAVLRRYPTADQALLRSYEPDSICGTWEYFGTVIGDDSGDKRRWAQAMGGAVTTSASRSRSPSFGQLISALAAPPVAVEPRRRGYRHAARPASVSGRR